MEAYLCFEKVQSQKLNFQFLKWRHIHVYHENFPFDFHLRSDRDHRCLLRLFLLTSTLISLAMLCFSLYKPQQHQSTYASVLLVHGHKPEHFEELSPKLIKIKNTQQRLKNTDYQLHSSAFEEFLLCNYFSHRCQCHNKYMKNNETQHKDAKSFTVLKMKVCCKPVLVFKVLPFPE